MAKLHILVCGDSFAASRDPSSWVSLLRLDHCVTQHGWQGCGEYKILQQLHLQNLAQFDLVIVSHTSSARVYIKEHPLYQTPHPHEHADLIYSDVAQSRHLDPVLTTANNYFEQIFDLEYYDFVHDLLLGKIKQDLQNIRSLHLFPLYLPKTPVPFDQWIDIQDIWTSHPGNVNHYSDKGNAKVYDIVTAWINKHFWFL